MYSNIRNVQDVEVPMFFRDQAERLRQLAARQEAPRAKMIAVTSGKGGVGKSNLCVNLAIALRGLKKQVTVVDVDLGLANLDVLLGISCPYTLEHIFTGEKSINDIIIEGPAGVRLVPGCSGVSNIADLPGWQRIAFIESLEKLLDSTDILITDTSAGLGNNVVHFALAADEVIIVTTPEPSAIVDAYAMIKTLIFKQPAVRIRLVINMARSEAQAITVGDNICQVTRSFLSRDIQLIGYILRDDHVSQAVMQKQPFSTLYPASPAAHQVQLIARRLVQAMDTSATPIEQLTAGTDSDKPRSIFSRFGAFFKSAGNG